MRRLSLMLITALLLCSTGIVQARDTKHFFSIAEAMSTESAKERLNGGVSFYFGSQRHPGIMRNFGESATNKKTNAFNKTDKEACEWVFLSAMLQLQEKALQLGANAVVNIQSYYKKVPFSSTTEYECHAGAIIAGVALQGKFVSVSN